MNHIQPYLDYFSAHPGWALAIIFLIAMGEALLVIGLFVPSTAVLVGAGILVGTGALEFWPVYIATTLGCIVGDQFSYWAGRFFGDRLRGFWPLNRYPALLAKGEDFVREHGGKSIAIGRFVPGVKAVVPGIVGMLGMNQIFFLVVNITSGAAWSIAHILPGILIGQGLALAGEVSGRLALVLVLLLAVLFVAGWLLRIGAASVAPYGRAALHSLSTRALGSRFRPVRRLGLAIDPENHRSTTIAIFLIVGFLSVIGLVDLMGGLVLRNQVSNIDLSVATLMSELRNAPADEFMITLAMLADKQVMWVLGLVIVLWLFFWRAWRAGLVAAGILVLAEALAAGMGFLFSRGSPIAGIAASDGSFPSSHVVMAGLVLGMLAVMAGHSVGRWSRAIVAAGAGVFAVAVGFARIYLGADWLSGVLGGLLLALLLSAVFGTVIEAVPSRRIRPAWLGVVAGVAFFVAATLHVDVNFEAAELAYSEPVSTQVFDSKTWAEGGWLKQPGRRIDMSGRPQEVFAMQWAGPLDGLQQILEAKGWSALPKWHWKDMLAYLSPATKLADLKPRPLLHQGLAARLTMVRAGKDERSRLVVRVYKTRAALSISGSEQPVFLVSLTSETLTPRLDLYAIPRTLKAADADVRALLDEAAAPTGAMILVRAQEPGRPQEVLAYSGSVGP